LWVVARTAALLAKIAEPNDTRWPAATTFLRALTNGGARAMGLSDRTGMLAPGREADIVLLDLASLPFLPLRDLRRQLLYGEVGDSVRMTIVGGRVVVDNGRILTVDETAVRARSPPRGHATSRPTRAPRPRRRACCRSIAAS